MGHCSIQVTVDLYGHLIPGGNKQAVASMVSVSKNGREAESATLAQPAPVFSRAPNAVYELDNWGFTVEGSNVYAKDQPGNSVEFCIGNCIFSSRFRQGHCRARSENPGGSQQSRGSKFENLRYRNLIGRVALAGSHTIHWLRYAPL